MNINKNEVLRYLGIKNKLYDKKLNSVIDSCIQETLECIETKYIFKIFNIEKKINYIAINKTTLILKGKDIYNHLSKSEMCAFLAATLGSNIDNKIRYYEKTDFTRSIILDACATAAIEELCDMAEEEIKAIALKKYGKNITSRYSPGYGDLSLEYQPSIINLLEASKRIGLTVTDSLILIPRKSVTAIIGFQDDYIIKESLKCNKCKNKSNCFYRKGENCCESQNT